MLRLVRIPEDPKLWDPLIFIFHRNNEMFLKHDLINATNITQEYSNSLVEKYNLTHPEWNLKHCSLEVMLSDVGEGTGLAFIIFTQAIVELPGKLFDLTSILTMFYMILFHRISLLGCALFHNVAVSGFGVPNRNSRRHAVYHLRYRHIQACTEADIDRHCMLFLLPRGPHILHWGRWILA